tara:strand:- start:47 stop:493 length:447 start_codon:yes stop_codon:yes gene_type:complete
MLNYNFTIINKFKRKKQFKKSFKNKTYFNNYVCKLISNGNIVKSEKIYTTLDCSKTSHLALSIISKKKLIPKTISCIYALIDSDEIVYVGETHNIMQRLSTHISKSVKKFTSYSIIEWVDTDENINISEIEKKYIKLLKPKYNIKHNS